jgi:C_GCAxxG_C_C family probable redox protein
VSRSDEAVRLFRQEHACSQAVLLAFAPHFGLKREDALRIAAGFGGGMRIGGACGALSGAIMVLGLALCEDGCPSKKRRHELAAVIESFAGHFKKRVGALDCPTIIGCDIRTEQGRAQIKEENLYELRCEPAIRTATEILEKLLAGG